MCVLPRKLTQCDPALVNSARAGHGEIFLSWRGRGGGWVRNLLPKQETRSVGSGRPPTPPPVLGMTEGYESKEQTVLKTRLRFLALVLAVGLSCTTKTPQTLSSGERYVHDPKMKETLVDVFPGMDGPNLNLTLKTYVDEWRGTCGAVTTG